MALLKVADFRIAQRPNAGYVLFKLINRDGSITDWIGWKYIPPGQLASLNAILSTHNAYYDDQTDIFTTGSARSRLLGNLSNEKTILNPKGITSALSKRMPSPVIEQLSKEISKPKSKRKKS